MIWFGKYFNKDTKLDTVKRKDVNFGIYYQHSFHALNLDHTLQYQWFQNRYKVKMRFHIKIMEWE